MEEWVEKRMNGLIQVWMDNQMGRNECVDGPTKGWMDDRMDGRVDGSGWVNW